MKVPKNQRRYCPHCDKHTEHEVRKEKVRVGGARALSKGTRKKNRAQKGHGNKGRYSKPPAGEKPTRRVDLRYECDECGKEQVIGKGFRAKRIEIER